MKLKLKPTLAIISLAALAACAPRYGFDAEDPDMIPVRFDLRSFNDYRYTPPTQSYIDETIPAGVLKETGRQDYYFEFDPKDTYKYKQYQGR